jgi:hypothetical protein
VPGVDGFVAWLNSLYGGLWAATPTAPELIDAFRVTPDLFYSYVRPQISDVAVILYNPPLTANDETVFALPRPS